VTELVHTPAGIYVPSIGTLARKRERQRQRDKGRGKKEGKNEEGKKVPNTRKNTSGQMSQRSAATAAGAKGTRRYPEG